MRRLLAKAGRDASESRRRRLLATLDHIEAGQTGENHVERQRRHPVCGLPATTPPNKEQFATISPLNTTSKHL